MHNYDTVTEALTDLKKRGYKYDFNLEQNKLHCKELQREYKIPKLEVKETYRFEENTDPADEAVIYAIAADDGVLGAFVNGYDAYADAEQKVFHHFLKKILATYFHLNVYLKRNESDLEAV